MPLYKSRYLIQKMDCPSEEQIIRMKLGDLAQIKKLEFDIPNRTLQIIHSGEALEITQRIDSLNFNSHLQESVETTFENDDKQETDLQKRLLWSVLSINFSFFILEIITGWIAGSMGLIADSLDMLADSLVYILSLIAVGRAMAKKKQVARISGYFQSILAVLGFWEVISRFITHEQPPNYQLMIIISALALIANGYSLFLLQKSKTSDAHMKASMIFTSNDVAINSGVILAGFLVYFFNSGLPDLIIGGIIFIIVIRGAFQILKLAKA